MRNAQQGASDSFIRQIPREILTIVGVAATIFMVVAVGGLFASALPADIRSPWLIMASYAAPAAAAFLIHWWLAQRR